MKNYLKLLIITCVASISLSSHAFSWDDLEAVAWETDEPLEPSTSLEFDDAIFDYGD